MPGSAPLAWLLVGALVGAVANPGGDPELAAGLVRTAQAAARAGRPAEASSAYLEAARLAPEVRDWLLLRAAEATPDSAGRDALYAQIQHDPARARVTAVEAAARERAGDWRGAALRYDSLGRPADAWRARLVGTPSHERRAARTELAARLARETEPALCRSLVDVFLAAFPAPTAAEALTLARADTRSRYYARAVKHHLLAEGAGVATHADRLAHGVALAELGRHRQAIDVLGRVGGSPALVAQARLRAARSRLRSGDAAGAIAGLWAVVERHPGESETAAAALLLLGDLARDRGEVAEARRIWLDLGQKYPSSLSAPRGRFLAALAAYEQGHPVTAAREWDRLRLESAGTESAASGFWAGRAWARAGKPEQAQEAWRSVVARDTLSYYAVLSARRLGTGGWVPASTERRLAEEPGLDLALERMAILARLELAREIGWEREALVAAAAGDPERLLAVADGFRRAGESAAAIRVARQALTAGAPGDARTYRLLYPVSHEPELRRLAAERGLEPAVLAALIRQESAWEPRATSVAGARGLMQVMPATGAQLARRLGLTHWHADRLYEPETNLRLGTAFLADVLRRYDGDLVRALAAYNAGPTRVVRWSERAPVEDPELFAERIPFGETRDYVRIVLRNMALYRALYDAA
jgi:soluble lytic murein transglycosylase